METSNGANCTEIGFLAKTLRLELKEWEQSFAAANQGRKAGREDIKQHPHIGQRLSIYYFSQPPTDTTKHKSTSNTTDCEDALQNNLPLTTLPPKQSALLPTLTLFPHLAPHSSIQSTLTQPTLQRFAPMIHRLLRTCLLEPTAHRSGLRLRRMAKSSGSSIHSPQTQTRRHLPNERLCAR